MERYVDEEQRSRAGRRAATRRDAIPCDARAALRLLDDPLRWVACVGAPCPAPQSKASQPRGILLEALKPSAHRCVDIACLLHLEWLCVAR